MTIRTADSPQDFRHHGSRAGSGSGVRFQADRPVPARLPRSYSPVWESGPGQAFAPQTSDDIARPEAGEEGVCLPVRADPGSSPKTRP